MHALCSGVVAERVEERVGGAFVGLEGIFMLMGLHTRAHQVLVVGIPWVPPTDPSQNRLCQQQVCAFGEPGGPWRF